MPDTLPVLTFPVHNFRVASAAIGLITMSLMLGLQLWEMHATSERSAGMTREVAFMIRRQYADIVQTLPAAQMNAVVPAYVRGL